MYNLVVVAMIFALLRYFRWLCTSQKLTHVFSSTHSLFAWMQACAGIIFMKMDTTPLLNVRSQDTKGPPNGYDVYIDGLNNELK